MTSEDTKGPTIIGRMLPPRTRSEERENLTYSSTQATECAGCGVRKHTPLRRDEMGGYACLTCIDKRLDESESARSVTEGETVKDKRIKVLDKRVAALMKLLDDREHELREYKALSLKTLESCDQLNELAAKDQEKIAALSSRIPSGELGELLKKE